MGSQSDDELVLGQLDASGSFDGGACSVGVRGADKGRSINAGPESDATQQSGDIGSDFDIIGHGLLGQFAGVAAAQIEGGEVERVSQQNDCAGESFFPEGIASRLQGCLSQQLFVSAALFKRMMGEFEIRNQDAIDKKGRADAGTEGQDQFDAGPFNGTEALNVGIVGDPHGLQKELFERDFQFEALPGLIEVGGGESDAATNDSGKPNGQTIEPGDLAGQKGDCVDDCPWSGRLRGGGRDSLGEGVASTVKKQDLDAGPPDIDREGCQFG